MSRQSEYQFVDTDSAAIEAKLISAYENITGKTLQPADPERLFIAWVLSLIVQERTSQNYTGNQNIPSRAEGENLDALGEWIYNIKRLAAQASKCTVRFNITAAQPSALIIPHGTRVTDASKTLVWYTTDDAEIKIGSTYVDQMVQCETVGVAGNGFVAGQINTLIDVDNVPYFASCENIETSNGGSEEADDDEYYELMRAGLDSYSTAGPKGAYAYFAKSVSTTIADVVVMQPKEIVDLTLNLYTSPDNLKVAFIGGEQLIPDSISVYKHGSQTCAELGVDYTYTYADSLLMITIKSDGALASENKIDVAVNQVKAGYVYIYALMDDGTIADSVIKSAILKACNDDTVRPLTDFVSCKDAEAVTYNINLTYYIKRGTKKSVADIQLAVQEAVGEYVAWQREKIGRDINPSKLDWLLRDTGIKRSVIAEPSFVALRSGDDHTTPQYASVASITVTNGGYEDE